MASAKEAIDRINAVFGSHPGHRALHAKGAFYTGTFTANPQMADLTRAGHLQGAPVDVVVRWSNGGGNPKVPDGALDVRGMAVSFRLADGTMTDLLAQTAPRFVARTPEDFLDFVENATPRRLPLFVLRHRDAIGALIANARARALNPPRSYALATYWAVHAYGWESATQELTWVRYRLRPDSSTEPDGKFSGPDRLHEELAARVAAGPVRYALEIQIAAADDDPHDPMSVWDTPWTQAGIVEITGAGEQETDGSIVVFDPTRVVDGIRLSDDPILHFRPHAYSESADRRAGGAKG